MNDDIKSDLNPTPSVIKAQIISMLQLDDMNSIWEHPECADLIANTIITDIVDKNQSRYKWYKISNFSDEVSFCFNIFWSHTINLLNIYIQAIIIRLIKSSL